ncbi:ZYRO0G06776p [Zygosaccharomyces rouxii]|uniref:ZYRO0G06776p n=1 Tax=Zygosaccharomyces rouxii (strain ATCC 2623 / CBS 732 / NBRC 1130 / NCYC 568 / NRRL Y-229) TaxID=559307 RepID=C5DZS3_ZYGRC|nr:uncharacterized protein ZYRO0G06776g [Zygosaccharomyces rouxii]CAR29357.1 ZYRO0G06776p [Zygosaccharomyces rouxii]
MLSMFCRTPVVSRTLQQQGSRAFTNTAYRALPHRKDNLTADEQTEQKNFDDNQARLEEMEHSRTKDVDYTHQRSEAELRKIGEDAQVEQNRPDDGVY